MLTIGRERSQICDIQELDLDWTAQRQWAIDNIPLLDRAFPRTERLLENHEIVFSADTCTLSVRPDIARGLGDPSVRACFGPNFINAWQLTLDIHGNSAVPANESGLSPEITEKAAPAQTATAA